MCAFTCGATIDRNFHYIFARSTRHTIHFHELVVPSWRTKARSCRHDARCTMQNLQCPRMLSTSSVPSLAGLNWSNCSYAPCRSQSVEPVHEGECDPCLAPRIRMRGTWVHPHQSGVGEQHRVLTRSNQPLFVYDLFTHQVMNTRGVWAPNLMVNHNYHCRRQKDGLIISGPRS